MITQSPESPMPEPYKTYVRQRSNAIATVLGDIITDTDVQLCPKAIAPHEVQYDDNSIIYGALVDKPAKGYKSALYTYGIEPSGIATTSAQEAYSFTLSQLQQGNRVRIKDPTESDGAGQCTVSSVEELPMAFESVRESGNNEVVLMSHLSEIYERISIGLIKLNRYGSYLYIGREENIMHAGANVFGGSHITLFNASDLESRQQANELLEIDPSITKQGLVALKAYKSLCLKLGRASVDILRGKTDNGTSMTTVVDITPRVGGVTPAEVLAIRGLKQKGMKICEAKSRLLYEPAEKPTFGTLFVDTPSLIIQGEVINLL